ncbi:hypothetical protein SAMN04487911_10574 [Arenibacter nanhaiticus]|uniref:Uncharacterized protein n=1 Tax=Arenibacter nanhaiticus TaxID=558155 RepID=A0A1M6DN50_9FLAO|nr:hypothetical protein SAMN04487911_10574 [Arenibacter nanhaiticus]
MFPIQVVAAVPGISTLKAIGFTFPIIFGVSLLMAVTVGIVITSVFASEKGIAQKTTVSFLFDDTIDKEVQYAITKPSLYNKVATLQFSGNLVFSISNVAIANSLKFLLLFSSVFFRGESNAYLMLQVYGVQRLYSRPLPILLGR